MTNLHVLSTHPLTPYTAQGRHSMCLSVLHVATQIYSGGYKGSSQGYVEPPSPTPTLFSTLTC